MEVLPSYNNTTFVCTWQMGLGIWRKHQFKAAQPFLELCIYKLTRDKIWRAQRDFLLGVTLCNTKCCMKHTLNYVRIFLLHHIAVQDTIHRFKGFCTSYQSLGWNKNWPLQIVSFCYNIVFLSAISQCHPFCLCMTEATKRILVKYTGFTYQTCSVPSFKSQSSLCS